MNLRDLIKLDEKYKKNILTFLSDADDERTRSFRSMGLNQTLKNITAYMIYATNKSYDEIEKCLLTKQWMKDEGWRLPTPEELELLMLTNETYFKRDDRYISNEISSDGIWVSCVWKGCNGKIFKERKRLTYRGSNYKSLLYTVLVTEKEF